jgi:arylsulfatase
MKPATRGAAALGAAVLAACSRGEPQAPTWIRLAALRTSVLAPVVGERIPAPSGREVVLTTDDGGARLAFEFRSNDWRSGIAGLWTVQLPAWTQPLRSLSTRAPLAEADRLTGRPEHAFEEAAPYGLRDESGDYRLVLAGLKRDPELPARCFTVIGQRLFVNPGSAQPPERLTLEVREERGPLEDGCRSLRAQDFSGEGLVVWPGEVLEFRLDLPPRSALHFGLGVETRLHRAFEQGRSLAFSVALDGAPLFAEEVARGERALRWRSVALPAAGGPATLAFSVRGPFAHAAFLAPVIGPLERGTPGARPWGVTRPDVLVFLADTFRADNLAAYGGRAELAPFLNELAARSLLFPRAWSTATYTLGAHASLFTGLFPRQAGIVSPQSAISRELPTLAGFFTGLGYRTGAVTDHGYVSQAFGMDRGFQVFDERKGTLEATAERVRAFLDADDGRPVFLFVQTYRTHMPYEVSDEACAAMGLERTPPAELEDLREEYVRVAKGAEGVETDRRRMAELAGVLERHYRASVWDLDRGFERIFRELEGRGLLRNGYLVFTSDHGEAFDEHAYVGHSGDVHEEQLRVPLFLHGPGLETGRVDRPVSLVDLPRTLAELAGAQARPEWLGESLLALAEERPVYAFQSHRRTKPGCSLCVIEGGRKVIGREHADELRAGDWQHAFDLACDPGELRSVADEAWPRELFERHRAALDAALRPRGSLASAAPTAEELRELEAMGYVGGDE